MQTNNSNKAIMQIHLDPSNTDIIAQDLKEYASVLSQSLGYDTEEILAEMSSDDIDHLIITFKKYFNEYVEVLNFDNISRYKDET